MSVNQICDYNVSRASLYRMLSKGSKWSLFCCAAKWGGVTGWTGVLATQLSTNSVYKKDVINAAKKGKRVKVTITDNKYYHTPYSTQVNIR